jgi:NADPH-dependent ferric siderophore reductase
MSDTNSPPARFETYRVRYPLRIRRLTVLRTLRLSPSMVRVTLTGDDLADFASRGHDDHVKLFFARPGEAAPVLPTFGPNGPVYPEGVRPTSRDYTPRRVDVEAREIDIDFALHEAGPATQWALEAAPGAMLHMGGPRGSMIVPDDFDWYLLVGDETALPAIARRMEELRSEARVTVIAEVRGPEDEIELPKRSSGTVTWLHRGEARPGEGSLLDEAVAAFAPEAGEGFVWVGCESDTAKRLRRILVEDKALSKKRVKASGYWKRGIASYHDTHDD